MPARGQRGPTARGGGLLPRHVSVCAPFSLPITIDPRRVGELGRGEVRRQLWARMARPGLWSPTTGSLQRYHDFNSELAERLREAAPQWVLEAESASLRQVIDDRQVGAVRFAARFDDRPVTLELEDAHLGLIDLGFGVITLHYAVDGAEGADGLPLDDGTAVSALIGTLSPVLQVFVEGFAEAVPDDLRLTRLLTTSHHTTVPECLWGHAIFCFREPAEDVLEHYPDLAPSAELGERPRARMRVGAFVPGLGASVLDGTAEDCRAASSVLALEQAYYSATASLERMLSSRTAALASRRAEQGELISGRVTELHELIETVSAYRSIFTTLDIHLAASISAESRVWQATSRLWRLDRQLAAIDAHLSDLQEAAHHLQAEDAASRGDLLTVAAFAFTVIAAISAFLDVIQFGQDQPLTTPDVVRTVVEVALVVVLSAFTLVLVRRLRK